jgi:hypothetical protein
VSVDWVRRADSIELALEVPPGARAELVDPPGFTFGAGERERGPGKHRLELTPA